MRRPRLVFAAASGAALVAAAMALGFLLAAARSPNWFDTWGLNLLPASRHLRLYLAASQLGSPPAIATGMLLSVLLWVGRDRLRAIGAVLGPLVAIGFAEQVAKPLIGRQLEVGNFSYPSGTVTAAAAVATTLVLAAPRSVRPPLAGLLAALLLVLSAAVVGLRWHDPTDALGGLALGVGWALLVEAGLQLLHLAHVRQRRHPEVRPATGN